MLACSYLDHAAALMHALVLLARAATWACTAVQDALAEAVGDWLLPSILRCPVRHPSQTCKKGEVDIGLVMNATVSAVCSDQRHVGDALVPCAEWFWTSSLLVKAKPQMLQTWQC